MPGPEQGRSDAAPFRWPVRVYFQDTDAGGVVFHATYLDFFERARMEFLRAIGFDSTRLAAEHQILFIVRHLDIAYRRPAALDDLLNVTVAVQRIGRAQFTLSQEALRADEMLVEAKVNLACVRPGSFKPAPIPQALRAALVLRQPDALALMPEEEVP